MDQTDMTFEAGNEEEFIRQLQEQLANEAAQSESEDSDEDIGQFVIHTDPVVEKKPKVKKKKTAAEKNKLMKTIQAFAFNFLVPYIFLGISTFIIMKFHNIWITVIAMAISAYLIGLYINISYTVRSKKTISTADNILSQVANGNLTFSVAADKDLYSILGPLSNSIDNVITEISGTVAKIELSVLDIVGNSDALAYFANSMANKTTQQEDSVTKIDNFTKLINQSMNSVRKNVADAYNNSKESIEEADKGSVEILSLIEEMKAINDMSDKIVETMNFINDIADETNLLALNAAIQAAHAGDEGRGFGVVASEIRNLAESSTSATKNIISIIDKTVTSIDKGVMASERAKRAIGKIVSSIKSNEDIMSEINEQITVQTDETSKLKVSVEDIKELTENINSDTQNMKSAISNLAGQAQILNSIIKKFEVHSSSVQSSAIFGVE